MTRALPLLLLWLTGCGSLTTVRDVSVPSPPEGPITVRADRIDYDEPAHLAAYERALVLVQRVVNSDAFRSAVLRGPDEQREVRPGEPETSACGEGPQATFSWNVVDGVCLDNEDVYLAMTSADWRLNLQVERRWWDVWCGWPLVNEVGHREGDTIVTQECHLEAMSDAELAGHLVHEYAHVLGFGHPKPESANRRFTVPYHVGNEAARILSGSGE